jgi:hypothetical protein
MCQNRVDLEREFRKPQSLGRFKLACQPSWHSGVPRDRGRRSCHRLSGWGLANDSWLAPRPLSRFAVTSSTDPF